MPAIRHLKLSRKYHPIKSNWLTSSLWPMISVGHSLLLQVLANEFTLFSLKQEFFLFLFLKSILHYIHFLNPQFINSPRATLKKKIIQELCHMSTAPSPASAPPTTSALPLDALKEKSPPLGSRYALLRTRYAWWGSKWTSLPFGFLRMFDKIYVLSFLRLESHVH